VAPYISFIKVEVPPTSGLQVPQCGTTRPSSMRVQDSIFRVGLRDGKVRIYAEGSSYLWNLYERGLRPVSISYGVIGKYAPLGGAYPLPEAWNSSILINIKSDVLCRPVECTS
jgi:hypothetical protein